MATENIESVPTGMVNPAIFEHLQAKIDEDSLVREELRTILQNLEKQGAKIRDICPHFMVLIH
jgi:hypothetical protein